MEAWLNALARWLTGAAALRSMVLWFETAEGAWGRADTRSRMEGVMSTCKAYEFKSARIDPAKHAHGFSTRERVFYVGIRRTVRWLTSAAEEAKEEWKREEAEEGDGDGTEGDHEAQGRERRRLAWEKRSASEMAIANGKMAKVVGGPEGEKAEIRVGSGRQCVLAYKQWAKLEEAERAGMWPSESEERGDELWSMTELEMAEAAMRRAGEAKGVGAEAAQRAGGGEGGGEGALGVMERRVATAPDSDWSACRQRRLRRMLRCGLVALGSHAKWAGKAGAQQVWYPSPAGGTAEHWAGLLECVKVRSLAVLMIKGASVAKGERAGVMAAVAEALPRTRIIALNLGEFGDVGEAALDKLEAALAQSVVGHLFLELDSHHPVQGPRKERLKAVLRANGWKAGYLTQMARPAVQALGTAQCWSNWSKEAKVTAVERALRFAQEGRVKSRAWGEVQDPMCVLMERGAKAYAELYPEQAAMDKAPEWNGLTLATGLQVKGSSLGGRGGRGLFQGEKEAPAGSTVLYCGERVTKAEAERRKADGRGGHIVQLGRRDDAGRLDGRCVADMFEPARPGVSCRLMSEEGGALGLGALANTAAVTNATLEWRYVSSERIGTPYVVLRAKRAIAPGEEWTVGYGSATPLECEMGCPAEDSEEEATGSEAEVEEDGAEGGEIGAGGSSSVEGGREHGMGRSGTKRAAEDAGRAVGKRRVR